MFKMENVGLPFFGPNIEYSLIPSVEPKRILMFFNQFVTQSAQLLNKFATISDVKLEELNHRLQSIEATLAILEAKLSSVPVEVLSLSVPSSSEPEPEINVKPAVTSDALVVRQVEEPVIIPPEILRFSKMLQVGVPLMAVEQKMRSEGLDPAFLRSCQSNPVPSPIVKQVDTDGSESDTSLSNQDD